MGIPPANHFFRFVRFVVMHVTERTISVGFLEQTFLTCCRLLFTFKAFVVLLFVFGTKAFQLLKMPREKGVFLCKEHSFSVFMVTRVGNVNEEAVKREDVISPQNFTRCTRSRFPRTQVIKFHNFLSTGC